MTEMVERVARAMFNEHCSQQSDGDCFSDATVWPRQDCDDTTSMVRTYFMDLARAAIAVMREQTAEMYIAGSEANCTTMDNDSDGGGTTASWRAAIDAALEENE